MKHGYRAAVMALAAGSMLAGACAAEAAQPRRAETGDGLVSGIKVGKTIDASPRYGHSRRGDRFWLSRHCAFVNCAVFAKYHRIYSGRPHHYYVSRARR